MKKRGLGEEAQSSAAGQPQDGAQEDVSEVRKIAACLGGDVRVTVFWWVY